MEPQGYILLQLTRSLPAVAKRPPSGLKLQQHTGPLWPRSSAPQGKSSASRGCVSSCLGHSRTVKSSALGIEREALPENQSKTGPGGQREPREQSTASKNTARRKQEDESPEGAQALRKAQTLHKHAAWERPAPQLLLGRLGGQACVSLYL